ncbi:MAG: hypothetical protein EBR30_12470 [Cytophagia bacterium]|nr:hypothetical protein [Cytophagia bacterium]
MKLISIVFSLALIVSNTQQENFDFKDLKIKGLDFNSTENAIVKSLSKGEKVVIIDEDYPCFLYYPEVGEKFYDLIYEGFTFTGNNQKGFLLNYLDFDATGKIQITYKEKLLSGLTTYSELLKVFSNIKKENFAHLEPIKEKILIYTAYSVTGAAFTFKNDRLIKFRFWYLC